jgi:hypothetical protein
MHRTAPTPITHAAAILAERDAPALLEPPDASKLARRNAGIQVHIA